jgi:alpha,alpha-trehalose phosphorylase
MVDPIIQYDFQTDASVIEAVVRPAGVTLVNHGAIAAKVVVGGLAHALAPGVKWTFPHLDAADGRALRAVIFDLDGVIVATDRFHYQAWKALADELNLKFSEKVNHRLRGVSRAESLKIIYRHNRRPLPDEATFEAQCAGKNARYVELVSRMTPADVLPGGKELLGALETAGVRAGLASASRNAGLVLERTGLAGHFDAVIDGGSAAKGKPNPQGFLLAALRLGVAPWDCIGVEDAEAGIDAIHRAGMVALGVGPAAGGADANVAGLREVSVDSLQRLFKRQSAQNAQTG